jgi:hypothetical protein
LSWQEIFFEVTLEPCDATTPFISGYFGPISVKDIIIIEGITSIIETFKKCLIYVIPAEAGIHKVSKRVDSRL